MQLKELLPLWQKQALQKELGLLRDLEKAYSAVKIPHGEYARAMSQMIESRKRVVEVWRKEISGAPTPDTKAIVEAAKAYVDAERDHIRAQNMPEYAHMLEASDETLDAAWTNLCVARDALSRLQGGKNA